ncbi:MAG: BTAD domain-containing putative transcriptional regulator [Anaerolineales bacterium]
MDVSAFENQAQELLTRSTPELSQFEALCYQGELLSDFYDDWILPLRAHYQTLYLDVLMRGVETARAQSEYQLAIEYARKILENDIANERAHQHLMFCHITLGDRNKALGQYETCQNALQDELGVEPARETRALYEWIKQSPYDISVLAARVTNLPIPISSFVGRKRELVKIKKRIMSTRLLTLTGAGGSGKTRLAIHATMDLIDSFVDGVWWVEFAPLTDPSLVPNAVAKALGIEPRSDRDLTETLAQYLRDKKLLLVLDNCEHLIESCAQLTEYLLTSCTDLKILSTSREALGLTGENVWQVPTLSLPDVQSITLVDLLMQYEGINLFVDRAHAVRRNFSLNEKNASTVAQVCQRLDGIPLAIELAAARVKTVSVEQISERLDDRFQLLTATNRTANLRHQTLRAAIDWSYELLSESESQLFCRLSIFLGGWTLEAGEAVCSGDGIEQEEILELLTHLVNKSLVTVTVEGQRYGMLETIRQYAKEKLKETGLEDWITKRHFDHFLRFAETADEKIRGPEQLAWREWLEEEHDNLTAALERTLSVPAKADIGGRLASALCWYWYSVGDFIQIKYWLERALHQTAHLGFTTTRAKVLFSSGAYSAMRVRWLNPGEACSVLEESRKVWHELGSGYTLEKAQCLLYLGYTRRYYFKDENGIDYICESLEIFKRLENQWWQAWAINVYGVLVWNTHDTKFIRNMLMEEESLWECVGDRFGQALVLQDMGRLKLDHGEFAEANEYLRRSLEIFIEFKAKGYLQRLIKNLGDAALGLGNYEQATTYYQESIQLAHMIGRNQFNPNVYNYLGYATLRMGDDQRAEEYFHQGLKIDQENNYKDSLVYCLVNFAFLATFRGNPFAAARLFGAFDANLKALLEKQEFGPNLIEPVDILEIDYYRALCKTQVDRVEFDQAWNEGRSLSIDDALNEIL